MRFFTYFRFLFLFTFFIPMLIGASDLGGNGCLGVLSNDSNPPSPPTPPPAGTFSIGGTLSGLGNHRTLVLQNNGGDNLSLAVNGNFTFSTSLESGETYAVTVLSQPSGEVCTVTNASGTLGTENVTNITVDCSLSAAIFMGSNSVYYLNTDGVLKSWGTNSEGELGVEKPVYGSALATPIIMDPTNATNPFLGLVSIGAGTMSVLSLKEDGTVWSWGYNSYGELGNGSSDQSNVPVQVCAPTAIAIDGSCGGDFLTGMNAVSQGNENSLALNSDGTVWAWGYNSNGQLGNGTSNSSNHPFPIQVCGPTATATDGSCGGIFLSDITAIQATYDGALALRSDGTLWSWGANDYGQLGNGTTTQSTIPVQVCGPTAVATDGSCRDVSDTPVFLTDVSQVGVGIPNQFSIVLKSDGTVWGWGSNYNGQLGNGDSNYTDSAVPVEVCDSTATATDGSCGGLFLSNVTQVCGGGYFAAALKGDGTVWTWGSNSNGALGNNSSSDNLIPVEVCDSTATATDGSCGGLFLTHIVQIACGNSTVTALDNSGNIWIWGDGTSGELANGQLQTYRNKPGLPLSDPGSFKWVFEAARQSGHNGNLGGPSGADDLCNADPNKPNSSTYKAMVVDSSTRIACSTPNCTGLGNVQLDWVYAANTQYMSYENNSILGTTTDLALFSFPMNSPPMSPYDHWWTGMYPDWTTYPMFACSGWTSSGSLGLFGNSSSNSGFINGSGDPCSANHSILCVEQ